MPDGRLWPREWRESRLEAKLWAAAVRNNTDATTWRLAKMKLAIRCIDGQIAHGDTFHNDRHPDLKADYVLTAVQRLRLARRATLRRQALGLRRAVSDAHESSRRSR